MTHIFGHLTYILIGLSYLLKNVLWLRVVALFASLFSIAFNYYAPIEPLWIPIGWNCLFVVINSSHIVSLSSNRDCDGLSAEAIDLAQTFFLGATPHQLSVLFRAGEWLDVVAGEVVIEQGSEPAAMMVLYHGEVTVHVDGSRRGSISNRTFLGEISFLTEQRASATVCAARDSRVLSWRLHDLNKALKSDKQLASLFHNWLALDLTRKLARTECQVDGELVLAR